MVLRKIGALLLVLFLLLPVLVLPVASAQYKAGEVLYHQKFADVSTTSVAGITKGTAGSKDSMVAVWNDALGLYSVDDRRTYALLPDIPQTDSYTIEFTFHYRDILSSNGYLAMLLTCWGEEPSNITSVVLRTSGTVDDFSAPSEKMVEKMQNGEEICVKIPVENGTLHAITLTAGDETCTLKRNSLKKIGEGRRGFSVRNTSAEISEIWIVNGTGYTAKTGYFADQSFTEDAIHTDGHYGAPPTGDVFWLPVLCILGSGIVLCADRRKKRLQYR